MSGLMFSFFSLLNDIFAMKLSREKESDLITGERRNK